MKITSDLIEAYLDGSLSPAQTASLKAWLAGHPADAAKMRAQESLRALLRGSAPVPSAQQSKAMWNAIRAKVQAQAAAAPPPPEAWYAFLFRPWGGTMTAGFAAAAVALVVVLWQPWKTIPSAPSAPAPSRPSEETAGTSGPAPSAASAPAVARARAMERDDAAPAMAKADTKKSIAAPAMAAANTSVGAGSSRPALVAIAPSAPAAQASEPTEVERALADSGVDGMIDAYLQEQRQGTALRSPAVQPGLGFRRSGGAALAGLTETLADDTSNAAAATAAQGHPDKNGFWNWNPAAVALNRRDWGQARVELLAAREQASESAERSFAGSALTLLSAPGAPLAGQGDTLPAAGDLRVLGAGRWQLLVDSRLARFSEGVSARLPGFRAEGDSLLLDLTFDRGTFAPGTRFIRLAGEKAAAVTNAQGAAVLADEFSAPSGATYNVSAQELKLR